MYRNEIGRFLEDLASLPTVPALSIPLANALEEAGRREEQSIDLIRLDCSLTANVLKLASSPPVGLPRRVGSLRDAISVLGPATVSWTALSAGALDVFSRDESEIQTIDEIWAHSHACAIASGLLANRFGFPDPERTFTAGLLHDLGKVVLMAWNSGFYSGVVAEAQNKGTPLTTVEEYRLGITHPEVARSLMERWRLPSDIQKAASLHHQPMIDSEFHNGPQLSAIVKLANRLCQLGPLGRAGQISDLEHSKISRITGLSRRELNDLLMQTLTSSLEVSEYFDSRQFEVNTFYYSVVRASRILGRQQVSLMMQNQILLEQERLLETVCGLQEEFTQPMTPGSSLETVLRFLGKLTSYRRLIGCLAVEDELLFELRIVAEGLDEFERFAVPFAQGAIGGEGRHLPLDLLPLIHQSVTEIAESSEQGRTLQAILRSSDLLAFPIQSIGPAMAYLFVEPAPESPPTQQQASMLRKFARSAALALDRNRLLRSLEQQIEEAVLVSAKLEETQDSLYQAERLASVGRLAAGAAHEINNPLATISAHAQILLRSVQEEQPRRSLETIVSQVSRISKIISDLMGLARPAKPQFQPTDVNSVIGEVLEGFGDRTRMAGIEVRQRLQEGIPTILADSRQLEQVFLNLVINGIQAMEKGGILTITSFSEEVNQRVRITVQDTGSGIPPDRINQVFEPFFSTKQEGKGLGLGLALTRSIIEAHGGEIEVSSALGAGTAFLIQLPIQTGELATNEPAGTPTKAKPDRIPGSRGSLLIIDDEADLRDVVAQALQLENYSVDLATDGLEGISKLRAAKYDLVLLDLRMPRMTGAEVIEYIRENSPDTIVIVISGLARETEFEAAIRDGAYACLKKPFEIDQLLTTVDSALHSRKA
jgi:signal transduction histidine kinase/HD-like signal output (HDOD) protein/CheY-like chemotaxis protein